MAARGPLCEQVDRAYELLQQAVTIDPDFSPAYAWLGLNAYFRVLGGYSRDRRETLTEGRFHCERAISIDESDAMARVAFSRVLGMSEEREASIRQARLAVELNPNLWWARQSLAWCFYHVMGEPELALGEFSEAIVRSPQDPMRWSAEMMMGASYRAMGEFEEAIRVGRASCDGGKSHLSFMHLAASLALAGDIEEAHFALDAARHRHTCLSLSNVQAGFSQMHEGSRAPLVDGQGHAAPIANR
ncbi:MAG: adenylate cyclase [Gammaproteobacteria bacterium]|jgi:adenylate cyclase